MQRCRVILWCWWWFTSCNVVSNQQFCHVSIRYIQKSFHWVGTTLRSTWMRWLIRLVLRIGIHWESCLSGFSSITASLITRSMRFRFGQPLVFQLNSVDRCVRRRTTRINGRCYVSRSHSIVQIPLDQCTTTRYLSVWRPLFSHRGNSWRKVTASIRSSQHHFSNRCINRRSTRLLTHPTISSFHLYRFVLTTLEPTRATKSITKLRYHSRVQ